MFARMTILRVGPEHIEDGIRIYRKSVLPEAKKQKGYHGACLLIDYKSGKCISVTFWRSEKDAVANEDNRYYQEQLVKYLAIMAGPMIREGYEVAVHALTPPAKPKTRSKARRRK